MSKTAQNSCASMLVFTCLGIWQSMPDWDLLCLKKAVMSLLPHLFHTNGSLPLQGVLWYIDEHQTQQNNKNNEREPAAEQSTLSHILSPVTGTSAVSGHKETPRALRAKACWEDFAWCRSWVLVDQ